jgi:mono/diheme cytochrome c family protein
MPARMLAVAAVAIVTAGCGGRALRTDSGRAVFAHECAGCHTLVGRERGAVGGDLVDANLGVADIASFALEMPTPSRLTAAQAATVARYIDAVAARLRRRHASR